jgi:hypothetical protein
MKRIERRFVLSDSSVNCYGYRVLTSGCQLDKFNPSVGYLMHNRDKGVAVRWVDLKVEGDQLTGIPLINDTLHPDLAQQIEDGFYNAASIGKIVPEDMDDSAALRLPGQDGPTLTKWYFKECSIVDIPGNSNALGQLYHDDGTVLRDLCANPFIVGADCKGGLQSAPTPQPTKNQEKMALLLTAASLAALGLPEGAAQQDADLRISTLADLAAKYGAATAELAALKADTSSRRIAAAVDKAMAERRVTKAAADQLALAYAGNPEGLESLLAAMAPQSLITDKLAAEPQGLPERFRGKTFNDLYLSGDLEALKSQHPEWYLTLKNAK